MTTQTHQPWKPTCWVGGWFSRFKKGDSEPWLDLDPVQIENIECWNRYHVETLSAATKATAAILRIMRK